MDIKFNIIDFAIRAPGIDNKEAFLLSNLKVIDKNAPLGKPTSLPMLFARRLSSGAKLAIDVAKTLTNVYDVDAVVFSSRHGELERNYNILEALSLHKDVSPTDFAMSVHNAAVANYTIHTKKKIPSSSVSSGIDSFLSAIIEALTMIDKNKRAVVVDFDGHIPDFYNKYLPNDCFNYAYAVGCIIENGDDFLLQKNLFKDDKTKVLNPLSIEFLLRLKEQLANFTLPSDVNSWSITRK